MADSTAQTPETQINMSLNDRMAELQGIKVRRRQITRREYDNTVRCVVSQHEELDDNSTSASETSSGRHNCHHRRRRARRQRMEKHSKDTVPLRLPWVKWMRSDVKNHMVAVIGEFMGTTIFLFFAFAGAQVANIPQGNTAENSTTGGATGFNIATLLYISLSFGFSFTVNAWVFFRISGGLFNPAVTLALALLKSLQPLRAALLFLAQLSGSCFAAILVKVIFPTAFNVQTTLAPGTSLAQGIWIEALCTAELIFIIIMLAKGKHRATYVAPIGIGLALFIGELVAVYYTGGSLNPARSFGPAAVSHKFESTHWIYWVGPFMGTLLAVAFYQLIKILEYEMANPGQDGDVENDPTRNPEHGIVQIAGGKQIEVEETQAIEEQGGFDALSDLPSGRPSFQMSINCVVRREIERPRNDEEIRVKRTSKFSEDLEAQ